MKLAVAMVIAVGITTLGGTGAGLATTRSGADPPQQPNGVTHNPAAISCPTPARCAAVGGTDDPATGDYTALAESWARGRWTLQRMPTIPAKPVYWRAYGVSCPTSSFCVAVGLMTFVDPTTTKERAFVTVWNGTRWRLQQTRLPRPLYAPQLYGVSCSSATSCTAVGDVLDAAFGTAGAYALAEHWNGRTWKAALAAPRSQFDAVSCPSASRCIAVGSRPPSSPPNRALPESRTLAEVWDGRRWTAQPTKDVTGALVDKLSGVSCTSKSACMAVGSSDHEFEDWPNAGIIERWNGKSWTVPSSNTPSYVSYNAVSCVSVRNCWAVGTYRPQVPHYPLLSAPLTERWNGESWTPVQVPNPQVGGEGNTIGSLAGVSCASANVCTAVGAGSTQDENRTTPFALVERWNGSQWAMQPTPTP